MQQLLGSPVGTPRGLDGMMFDHRRQSNPSMSAGKRPQIGLLRGLCLVTVYHASHRIYEFKEESISYLWGITLLEDITRGTRHGLT